MAAKTRIYVVEGQDGPRLVDAVTTTAAVAHVAKKTIKARLATQRDLFDAAKAGVEIEVAGAEPAASGESGQASA